MTKASVSLLILLTFILILALTMGPSGFHMDISLIASIRAPRVFTAALAGAAVSAAGALSQSLFRNALATPSIIGTEAGAAFAIALATLILSGGDLNFGDAVIYSSIGAAAATLLAVAILNMGRSSKNLNLTTLNEGLNKLLLGGFAMNAFLAAGTSLCMSIIMEQGRGLNIYHWLMGSFAARTWEHVIGLVIAYTLCVTYAWLIAPRLDLMSLGDDAATSLGINVFRDYKIILVIISVLVGSAISCGGALPFVGLVAPHIARLLVKPHVRSILLLSSLIGACLTIAADLAARTVRAPIDMDVGILTTMIGAPYFLWLMMRKVNT